MQGLSRRQLLRAVKIVFQRPAIMNMNNRLYSSLILFLLAPLVTVLLVGCRNEGASEKPVLMKNKLGQKSPIASNTLGVYQYIFYDYNYRTDKTDIPVVQTIELKDNGVCSITKSDKSHIPNARYKISAGKITVEIPEMGGKFVAVGFLQGRNIIFDEENFWGRVQAHDVKVRLVKR